MRAIGALWPEKDYPEILAGVAAVKYAADYFKARGARIEIPHEHRYWEYATPVQMLLNEYAGTGLGLSKVRVLDVGAGWGAFGPTLALVYGTEVVESEPGKERFDRATINKILLAEGKSALNVFGFTTDELDLFREYDMVTCISVIEHMPPDVEHRCWKNLTDKIKPGGLLYVDMDCVEDASKKYTFDELRTHNFTIAELKERVELLKQLGMEPLSEPDYEWHGAHVYDFTFFRIGMRKTV